MAGQLGHNDQGLCVTAVSPVGLAGIPIARIAAGDAHSVLVTHNGSVMVCGHGYSLGRGVANDNAATMPPAVWSSKLGALLNGHVTPKAGEVERGDVCQLAPLAVPVESKFRALKLAGTLASSVSNTNIAVKDAPMTMLEMSARLAAARVSVTLQNQARDVATAATTSSSSPAKLGASATSRSASVGRRLGDRGTASGTRGTSDPPRAVSVAERRARLRVTEWVHEVTAGGSHALVVGDSGYIVGFGSGAMFPKLAYSGGSSRARSPMQRTGSLDPPIEQFQVNTSATAS